MGAVVIRAAQRLRAAMLETGEMKDALTKLGVKVGKVTSSMYPDTYFKLSMPVAKFESLMTQHFGARDKDTNGWIVPDLGLVRYEDMYSGDCVLVRQRVKTIVKRKK